MSDDGDTAADLGNLNQRMGEVLASSRNNARAIDAVESRLALAIAQVGLRVENVTVQQAGLAARHEGLVRDVASVQKDMTALKAPIDDLTSARRRTLIVMWFLGIVGSVALAAVTPIYIAFINKMVALHVTGG